MDRSPKELKKLVGSWVRFYLGHQPTRLVICKVCYVTLDEDYDEEEGIMLNTEVGTLPLSDVLENRGPCRFDRPSLESCGFNFKKFQKKFERWLGRWVRSYRSGVLTISQVEGYKEFDEFDQSYVLHTEEGPVDVDDVLEVR